MLYRLVRPVQRKDTSHLYFAQRIPQDVKARGVGLRLQVPLEGFGTVPVDIKPGTVAIRLSLRTRDPSEAKVRQAAVAAYLENVWRGLRQEQPTSLTHKQATALAGELYGAWAGGADRERSISVIHNPETGQWERDQHGTAGPELMAEWEATAKRWAKLDGSDLEPHLGPLVDRLLLAKGIGRVDERSRTDLLHAFWLALRDAFAARQRNAEGDYTPDPQASRFPEWQGTYAPLTGLVEDWWREAKAAGLSISTYEAHGYTVRRFVKFLGHDDAGRVSTKDVIRYKDYRLGEVSARTVKDKDLVGLKTVFRWAVANGRMASNPAEGVTVKLARQERTRPKDFTQDEAKTVLSHALRHKRSKMEHPKTFAAKRWAPWLCAYTGARVGEVLQLRKKDVRQEGKYWIITITPEAGTVKGKQAREVPLHSHLVELGFPEFVKSAPEGYLFLTPTKGGEIRGRWRAIKNRVVEFVRKVITDKNVAPNHAWRHLFKTVGFEAGIQERVLDEICGHAPRHTGGGYGRVPLSSKIEAVKRFPRFKVEGGTSSN